MVAYRMKHNAVQMPVIKPVLIVYIIRTLTIVSVFRKPVRFFASIMHKDDAIRASATTALAKAKYSKYDILAKLANVLRRMVATPDKAHTDTEPKHDQRCDSNHKS